MIKQETWKLPVGLAAIYTEDCALAKWLKSSYELSAVYYKNTSPFGWQFIVPRSHLNFISRAFHSTTEPENLPLTNQRVTGQPFLELAA